MRPIHLPFISAVSGVSFRQEVLREIVEGDQLTVSANPDNPYDSNACEVRTGSGDLAGFIPKALAQRLVARDEGAWTAVVREVLRSETWGLRIEVLPVGAEVPDGPRDDEAVAAAVARSELDETSGPRGTGRSVTVEGDEERKVTARSGRALGRLVRVTETHVVVDRDGVEVNYPAELVCVS